MADSNSPKQHSGTTSNTGAAPKPSPIEWEVDTTQPDWALWKHLPVVKVWQAVALSLDLEPDVHKGGSAQTLPPEFHKRLRIAEANLEKFASGRMVAAETALRRERDVKVADFLRWASKIEWSVPVALGGVTATPQVTFRGAAPDEDVQRAIASIVAPGGDIDNLRRELESAGLRFVVASNGLATHDQNAKGGGAVRPIDSVYSVVSAICDRPGFEHIGMLVRGSGASGGGARPSTEFSALPSYGEQANVPPRHTLSRVEHRQVEQETPDGVVGWYDAGYCMDASFWWSQPVVHPREAAMLLCQVNPNHPRAAPKGHRNWETDGAHFTRLLRAFEGLHLTRKKHRTLEEWVAACQHSGLKYHSWIDEYLLAVNSLREERQTVAVGDTLPTPVGAAGTAVASAGTLLGKQAPVQRAAAQDAAILAEIAKKGCDPLALPKNKSGKPGVKAEIRSAMGSAGIWAGTTIFDKAWERLKKNGDIKIIT